MPIKFGNGGDGSGLPFIRFSPSVNAWTKSGQDASEEFDPKSAPMIIDVERLQMGWMLLEVGNRDWQPWPSLYARTKKPEGDYREGFAVHVYSKKLFGEDVHEFSANNVASTMFIQNLYNTAEPHFGKGNVPVVQITGTEAKKIGKGNTRNVLFNIVKWVPRPAELEELAVEEEEPFVPDAKPSAKPALASVGDEF